MSLIYFFNLIQTFTARDWQLRCATFTSHPRLRHSRQRGILFS